MLQIILHLLQIIEKSKKQNYNSKLVEVLMEFLQWIPHSIHDETFHLCESLIQQIGNCLNETQIIKMTNVILNK